LPLWRIESETARAHLLGSVHALPADFYPLPAAILDAYDASEVLVLEVDISRVDQEQMQQLMRATGYYKANSTLATELPPPTLALLDQYIAKRRLPEDVNRMKPWLVALNVGLIELAHRGYFPAYGIDQYFMNRAIADGKPILQLETMREQIEMLAADPPTIQALSLHASLAEVDEFTQRIDDLMTAWRQGDPDRLLAVSKASTADYPALAGQMARIIDQRNVTMAEKIGTYLAKPGQYFIVVGALHLGGESGLIRLLRQDFVVTQVAR
ncbi:MAG: TraB/GumN family protein, partial [Pseudomonadales bacterium]